MVVTFSRRKLALRAAEPGGWRNGHQTPRSQAPWEGIRRKGPPDSECIETRFLKKGTEVTKADSGGMEPGEAAGHILRAAVDGKDFESSGVPDTPRNRDLHAKITREVQAIPAGHVVDIPWDYAADE